ncbi:hypothetical protein [Runella slithyformis]|nr:hypothetical protein [Runella slithyformis]
MALVVLSYFCHTSQAQNGTKSPVTVKTAQTTLNISGINLQKLEKYEESLRIFHNRKFGADRKEFIETTKKKWWYYLPNVGFTFGMPTIGTNTGTLAQIDRDRQTKKAKLEALQAKAEFEYREELLQLRTKYKTLLLESQTIQELESLLGKKVAITSIYTEGFNANKITPLEMLREEVAQETAKAQMKENERRLIKLFFELEAFAHYNYPANEELIKFADMDCEMSTLSTRPE